MEKSLMKGNEALAEAAIRAGCKCFFGYPITPQTELSAYMAKRMEKAGGVFLQAESEIARDQHGAGCRLYWCPCHDFVLVPGGIPESRGHLVHGRL